MSFKFNVQTTDEIRSAKVFLLEGIIEEGVILSNSQAKVMINGTEFPINIKNAVIINRTRKATNQGKLTLNIEQPNFDIKKLEGQVLIG